MCFYYASMKLSRSQITEACWRRFSQASPEGHPFSSEDKIELWCVGCQSGFRFFKWIFEMDEWIRYWCHTVKMDEEWRRGVSWSNIDTSTAALRIYTCFTLSTFSLGAQGLKGPRLGRLVAFFNFWATCRSTCRWLQRQIVDQRPVTMMRSMMQWLSQSNMEYVDSYLSFAESSVGMQWVQHADQDLVGAKWTVEMEGHQLSRKMQEDSCGIWASFAHICPIPPSKHET